MNLFIFDIDGTILNSLNIDDGCFRDTLESIYNVKTDDIQWSKSKNETSGTDSGILNWLSDYYLKKILSDEEAEYFKKMFHSLLETEFKKYSIENLEIPGVLNILDYLINKKCCVSIATGSWYQSALLKLGSIGIPENRFPISASDNFLWRIDIIKESIIQSEEFYLNKFDSEKYFDKVIYIGDGIWDLKTAKELNIEFIGIDYKKNKISLNS